MVVGASQYAGLLDRWEIDESWTYIKTCDCPPPLAGVRELYEMRREMGKDTPTGRAAKLVYNSIYGKFAQSVGEPRWKNIIWAGLITAGCRMQILQAIASHPLKSNGVSMIATDSIAFDTPHPGLAISDQLGRWSLKEMQNLTLFGPGIYWDDAARERIAKGESVSLKSRGIAASDIAHLIRTVDTQFDAWTLRMPWPTVTVPIKFAMITCEQAIQWNKWELAGRVRQDATRTLDSEPFDKRGGRFSLDFRHGHRLIPDQLYRDSRGWCSRPYVRWYPYKSVGYDVQLSLNLGMDDDEMISPEGSVDALFHEALVGGGR